MTDIYGAPQNLSGIETLTILQVQNGQLALCTATLNQVAALASFNFAAYAQALPTTKPSTTGVVWNDAGSISIS